MNLSFLRNVFFYLGIALLLVRCASTGSPSGGPKDERPPQFIQEKSSPNFSTNYTPQKIELVFDEYVELKNQNKEILISPPFFKKPKISQRGKKVTVTFPEEEALRPDATYIINFGNSIVDFTEANPAEGFKFLFATGEKLDSLTFDGSIVDAYGGEAVGDVLIMLYDLLGDSVVVTEKPFYYSRADDKGKFEFEYLKNDTFKLVVIEDLNYNFLLDDEVERLAFIDSTFMLNDSTAFEPQLRLFLPEQTTRIINSSSKTPGVLTTVFNKDATNIDHSVLYPNEFLHTRDVTNDTIRYWFSEVYDSVGLIFGVDTLDFTIRSFDSTFYSKKIRIIDNNLTKNKLAPFDSLTLSFNAPLSLIDTSFFVLSDQPKKLKIDSISFDNDSLSQETIIDSLHGKMDSLGNRLIQIDSITHDISKSTKDSIEYKVDSLSTDLSIDDNTLLDSLMTASVDSIEYYHFNHDTEVRDLNIWNEWKEGHEYQLVILPGGVIDIYGRASDTITLKFTTSSIDEFGNINLTVNDLDSTQQYVVILREKENQISKRIIKDVVKEEISFKRLLPNTYNIHLIKDENRDNKWTTGDYWTQKQPELLKKFDLEKLRENWDLDAQISWEGIKNDTLGVGIDSTFIQLDSLDRQDLQIPDGSQIPKKKQSNESENKNKGIRERRR